MSFELSKHGLVEFGEYAAENADDDNFARGAELAQKWGDYAIRFALQYSQSVEAAIQDGLILAQGLEQGSNPEGQELEYDFPTVMRAADILSRFWKRRDQFISWQYDLPYENTYGNWIDPLSGQGIEPPHGLLLKRQRSAGIIKR